MKPSDERALIHRFRTTLERLGFPTLHLYSDVLAEYCADSLRYLTISDFKKVKWFKPNGDVNEEK